MTAESGNVLRCPSCKRVTKSIVKDSREAGDGSRWRRRRECLECGGRFTTYEEAPHKGRYWKLMELAGVMPKTRFDRRTMLWEDPVL